MPSTTSPFLYPPERRVSVSKASTVAVLTGGVIKQHPFPSGMNFSSWLSVKPFHVSQIKGWHFTHSCAGADT